MPGERQERRRETISGSEIVHPKAMPVILATPTEVDLWLTEEMPSALELQRPLPDNSLRQLKSIERQLVSAQVEQSKLPAELHH